MERGKVKRIRLHCWVTHKDRVICIDCYTVKKQKDKSLTLRCDIKRKIKVSSEKKELECATWWPKPLSFVLMKLQCDVSLMFSCHHNQSEHSRRGSAPSHSSRSLSAEALFYSPASPNTARVLYALQNHSDWSARLPRKMSQAINYVLLRKIIHTAQFSNY